MWVWVGVVCSMCVVCVVVWCVCGGGGEIYPRLYFGKLMYMFIRLASLGCMHITSALNKPVPRECT